MARQFCFRGVSDTARPRRRDDSFRRRAITLAPKEETTAPATKQSFRRQRRAVSLAGANEYYSGSANGSIVSTPSKRRRHGTVDAVLAHQRDEVGVADEIPSDP
jgi:hypothetical protein